MSLVCRTGVNLQNATQWRSLVDEVQSPGAGDALLWPIGVRDCADHDNCLGVTHSNGDCVCYAPTAATDAAAADTRLAAAAAAAAAAVGARTTDTHLSQQQ